VEDGGGFEGKDISISDLYTYVGALIRFWAFNLSFGFLAENHRAQCIVQYIGMWEDTDSILSRRFFPGSNAWCS